MLKSNLLQFISEIEGEVLSEKDKIKIAEYIFNNSLPAMTLEKILEVVMLFFNLDKQQIMQKTRRREIILARHFFYYVSVKLYNYSLQKAGFMLRQDHSTVLYATKQVENMIEVYQRERILLERLKIEIKRFAVEKRLTKITA
jgi:chromosomal replication initiator protein